MNGQKYKFGEDLHILSKFGEDLHILTLVKIYTLCLSFTFLIHKYNNEQ